MLGEYDRSSSKASFKMLEGLLDNIDINVATVLDRALNGEDISVEQAVVLFDTTGLEYNAVLMTADELRRRAVGDLVTYVVNRNINFTNVCVKRCGFCAFSRDHRQEEGYMLPINEIVRRAKEAWDLGATEVCVQAGLPPKMPGDLYIRLCESIKNEVPDIHVHGFSPEEVLYGSVRSICTIKDYLRLLKGAGVGSLPGTSAEILDQDLRDKVSSGRISVDQWVDVITTAHELGIPTTATIMYGFLETNLQKARHIGLIRDIQKSSGGFTEFVPLSFVHTEAPMYSQGFVDDVRKGPSGTEVLKMHAVARVMLNNWIHNIQVSWVKEGLKLAQSLLVAGVNDMSGTLINESISTAAGSQHGQMVKPSEFRQIIRDAGRIPAERYTTYKIRRTYDQDDNSQEALDLVGGEANRRFGSYSELVKTDRFRYKHPKYTDNIRESLPRS